MKLLQKKWIVLLVALWFFAILCILLCLIILGIPIRKRESNEQNNDEIVYKYFEYDTKTNKTQSGFVLSSQDFISNGDDFYTKQIEDKYILISSIESEAYKCYGSCYCEKDRRSTSIIGLKNSIFVLVAALTSYLALESAKEYFEGYCESNYYNHDCDDGEFKFEVNSCKNALVLNDEFEDKEVLDQKRRYYFCKGSCVSRIFGQSEVTVIAYDFGCEEMKLNEGVYIDCNIDVVGKETCEYMAVQRFVPTLSQFCREQSVNRVKVIVESSFGFSKVYKDESMCDAMDDKRDTNPENIQCFGFGSPSFMVDKREKDRF